MSPRLSKAAFAAGCFWGVQQAFDEIRGVVRTVAGFSGGRSANPSYGDVCSGETGHAETVYMEYDPGEIDYASLLEVFWRIHDPTTPGRQGPDTGSQYRSVIFYFDESQRKTAHGSLAREQLKRSNRIVTEIRPMEAFYPAEEYHQHYLDKRSHCL